MTALVSANTSSDLSLNRAKRPVNSSLSGQELSFTELILSWDETSILMDIAGEQFVAQTKFSLNDCINIYRRGGVKFLYE